MIKKLERDFCLVNFRNFPLLHYDKKENLEFYYEPKFISFYWLKVDKEGNKNLINEVVKLINLLKLDDIIFLDAINKPWINKHTSKRKDYKPLIKTLEYFKSKKIYGNFNGGILVENDDLKEFLFHFFRITVCDSGFFHFHFMDKSQKIIFYLHYSGELKILTLNKKIDIEFLKIVKETNFIDSFRHNTNRI